MKTVEIAFMEMRNRLVVRILVLNRFDHLYYMILIELIFTNIYMFFSLFIISIVSFSYLKGIKIYHTLSLPMKCSIIINPHKNKIIYQDLVYQRQ